MYSSSRFQYNSPGWPSCIAGGDSAGRPPAAAASGGQSALRPSEAAGGQSEVRFPSGLHGARSGRPGAGEEGGNGQIVVGNRNLQTPPPPPGRNP